MEMYIALFLCFLSVVLYYFLYKKTDREQNSIVGTYLYAAMFNDKVLVSEYKIISLHLSRVSAERAIKLHRDYMEAKHIENQEKFNLSTSFEEISKYKDWKVDIIKVEY